MKNAIVYSKKIFSLAITFNALLSIVYAIGLLAGFYVSNWAIYQPYFISANLLWMLILASIINIFPSVNVGKVNTGRLWFHHYVYGFFVFILSAGFIILFTPASLINLFTINSTNTMINIGRFFILGGLTLVIDDLPDVSRKTSMALKFMKQKAYEQRRIIHFIQLCMGFVILYILIAVIMYLNQYPLDITLANCIFVGTLMITCLTSFISVKMKVWLKVKPS